MRTFVIIPAGGKGVRSGFSAPKQYLKIHGKELIVHTLSIFQKNKNIDEIVVAADPAYIPFILKLKKKYRLSKISAVVEGGKERQDSVYNALKSIKASKRDLVIVHDAARPLLSQDVLNSAVSMARTRGNALVCLKARDTLVKGEESVSEYIDRNEVCYVQTPQIFRYSDLLNAMILAEKRNFYGTDESMLVKKLGKTINITEGSVFNIKVTTKSDIELVKKLLKKQ